MAVAAGLLLLGSCSPRANQTPTTVVLAQARKPYAVKPGLLLPYDPQSAEELHSTFPDLILMVHTGQLFAEEARQFIRFKKMQLGLSNPNQTPVFDRLLSQQAPQ